MSPVHELSDKATIPSSTASGCMKSRSKFTNLQTIFHLLVLGGGGATSIFYCFTACFLAWVTSTSVRPKDGPGRDPHLALGKAPPAVALLVPIRFCPTHRPAYTAKVRASIQKLGAKMVKLLLPLVASFGELRSITSWANLSVLKNKEHLNIHVPGPARWSARR